MSGQDNPAERLTAEISYLESSDIGFADPGPTEGLEDPLTQELHQQLGNNAYRLAILADGSPWQLRPLLEAINQGRVHGFGTNTLFSASREMFGPTRFFAYLLDDLELGNRVASHFLDLYRLAPPATSQG